MTCANALGMAMKCSVLSQDNVIVLLMRNAMESMKLSGACGKVSARKKLNRKQYRSGKKRTRAAPKVMKGIRKMAKTPFVIGAHQTKETGEAAPFDLTDPGLAQSAQNASGKLKRASAFLSAKAQKGQLVPQQSR
jgi:hypothetical protein